MKKPLLIIAMTLLALIAKTQANLIPTLTPSISTVGLAVNDRKALVGAFDMSFLINRNILLGGSIGKSIPYPSEKYETDFVQWSAHVSSSVAQVATQTHLISNVRFDYSSNRDAFFSSSFGISYIFNQMLPSYSSSSERGGLRSSSERNSSKEYTAHTGFSLEVQYIYEEGKHYIGPEVGFDSRFQTFLGGVRIGKYTRFIFTYLIR